MAECLGSPADFADMWHASGSDDLASTHIPIIIHEDGVPHFSGIWTDVSGNVESEMSIAT